MQTHGCPVLFRSFTRVQGRGIRVCGLAQPCRPRGPYVLLTNRHRSFAFPVKPWLRKGNDGMAAAQNGRLFPGDLDPVTADLTAQVLSRAGSG